MSKKETKLIMVKSSTNVRKLADSIFASHEEDSDAIIAIRVIGAGALNQAVKGVILSNKQFVKNGNVASVLPSFRMSDNDLTSIELKLIVNRI